MIRFVHFFNYAGGVSAEDGEKWYMDQHVPLVKALPGIERYVSWKAEPPVPLPSPDVFDRFVRRSDAWFETLGQCLKAIASSPDLWTPSAEGSGRWIWE